MDVTGQIGVMGPGVPALTGHAILSSCQGPRQLPTSPRPGERHLEGEEIGEVGVAVAVEVGSEVEGRHTGA